MKIPSVKAARTQTISVVIPAYNVEEHIHDSVRSAFSQSQAPLEVIVVDDGSSDNTANIAELAGATVLRQKNLGVSAARNRGIAEARGEWIAFLDADDRWHPEKLQRQCEALKQYPQAHLLATDFSRVRQQVVQNTAWMATRRVYRDLIGDRLDEPMVLLEAEELAGSLVQENFIPTSSVMVRRELLGHVGGFDESMRYCEDHDCWLRVVREHAAVIIQAPLVTYRMHESSASSQWENILAGDVRLARQIQEARHRYHPRVVETARRRLTESLFKLGQHFVRTGEGKAAIAPLWESLRLNPSPKTLMWLLISTMLSSHIARTIYLDIRAFRNAKKTHAT